MSSSVLGRVTSAGAPFSPDDNLRLEKSATALDHPLSRSLLHRHMSCAPSVSFDNSLPLSSGIIKTSRTDWPITASPLCCSLRRQAYMSTNTTTLCTTYLSHGTTCCDDLVRQATGRCEASCSSTAFWCVVSLSFLSVVSCLRMPSFLMPTFLRLPLGAVVKCPTLAGPEVDCSRSTLMRACGSFLVFVRLLMACTHYL